MSPPGQSNASDSQKSIYDAFVDSMMEYHRDLRSPESVLMEAAFGPFPSMGSRGPIMRPSMHRSIFNPFGQSPFGSALSGPSSLAPFLDRESLLSSGVPNRVSKRVLIFETCDRPTCEQCPVITELSRKWNGPQDTSHGVQPASQGDPPSADGGRSPLDEEDGVPEPDAAPNKDSINGRDQHGVDFQEAGNESRQTETSPIQDVPFDEDVNKEDNDSALVDSTVGPNRQSWPGGDATIDDPSEGVLPKDRLTLELAKATAVDCELHT